MAGTMFPGTKPHLPISGAGRHRRDLARLRRATAAGSAAVQHGGAKDGSGAHELTTTAGETIQYETVISTMPLTELLRVSGQTQFQELAGRGCSIPPRTSSALA